MKFWPKFEFRLLDGNHHGPEFSTLRSTWQLVRMGSYAKSWTLYVYRADGRAHYLNVTFPRWIGSWPEGDKR